MAAVALKAAPSEGAQERRWSPYVDNGGTVVAVAGADFAVIAGDLRMSYGYSIASRNVPKLHELTPSCVVGTAGMQAEREGFWKRLDIQVKMYENAHQKKITAPSAAQLIGNLLYYKRFFPWYTFNVVAGLDAEGKGAVWGYDAVGSFERTPYVCTGSGSALVTSLLDNQVAFKTQPSNKHQLSLEEVVDIVKDALSCAGERDIYTGDKADVWIVTKAGIRKEELRLKLD